MTVEHGEFVAVLGPSGCGKTTLLRLVAGFETLDDGRISIGDRLVSAAGRHVPPEERRMGIVFQSYALWPHMSVAENVAYALKVQGLPAADREARVVAALDTVGLSAFRDRRPAMLSGGQRQRVALARCLAMEPDLVLLDEPLANLDVHLRASMEDEFASFHKRTGTTMFYITHDQAEAMSLGDRIVVMKQGEIVQVGTPREVYFEPNSRFVAEFIGAANVIEGMASERSIRLPGGQLLLPEPRAEGRCTLMLRPEAIEIRAPEGEAWTGTVQAVSFLGDRQRVTIAGAATELIVAEAPNRTRLTTGDRVGLAVAPQALRILQD